MTRYGHDISPLILSLVSLAGTSDQAAPVHRGLIFNRRTR
jgi:hypothetical protein